MKIKEFLINAETNAVYLAKAIGISPYYMRRIITGKATPSRKVAEELEKFTRGIISVGEVSVEVDRVDHVKKFIEENAKIAC